MTLSVLERGGLSLHGGALRDDGASLYLRKDAQVVQYGDLKQQGMLTLAAIGNPGTPTITPVGTAGSTTYGYKIVATVAGEDSAASAEGTTTTGNATLSSTNYNEVTWAQVLGATGYKVYRTTGGATQGLISTITDGGVTTLNDTGLAGGGETASSANSTGCLVLGNGKGIRTGKTASDAFLLQAYDVDGAVWTTFITLTAGNTPSCTIANATMSGTWLASGTVVLPAVTMGDTIIITNGKFIKGSADDGSWSLVAGLNATYYDSNIWLYGSTHSTKPGSIEFRTYSGGTPGTASGVLRLTLAGNAATVAATWNATYHVGLKHGLAGTATGAFTMDGATSGVVTVTVNAVAGTWTMTLPAAVAAAAGYQLADNDGAGTCAWTAAASLRELKNIIGQHSPQDALDKILHTRVYDFHYKEGKGTRDTNTLYTGIMADEAPWAMHFQGGIVNPVNTLGYCILGFQAHEERIRELEQELAELKGRA